MCKDSLIFGSPAIRERRVAEVVAMLRSGWIGPGLRVARFEEKFREYIGTGHAITLHFERGLAAPLDAGFRRGIWWRWVVANLIPPPSSPEHPICSAGAPAVRSTLTTFR